MTTLRFVVVLCFLLAGCAQPGAGGNGLVPGGGAASGMSGPASGLPAGSSEGTPSGAAEPSLDTPPMAGPSGNNDVKPETPVMGCDEEVYGVNCPEVLTVSRQTLCTRPGDSVVNPVVTGSQAKVTSLKPLTSNGVVDFKIWRYSGQDNGGNPSDYILAPMADLKVKEPDADPGKTGLQLTANPDGTVTLRLVAGERTGYYEFWALGDLDTAFGSLSIEDCGQPDEVQ